MDDETIEGRFELVADQVEHLCQRVEALEQAREESHGRRINGWMLGLFVVEVVIGLVEIWMMRHA